MSDELTSDEVVKLLNLEPNATCGFVRVTFLSKQSVAPGGLPAPFSDGRPLGSALYFLVTPEAPVRLHRIRNDQLYHYYLGDPLELFLLHSNARAERVIVGPDISGPRVCSSAARDRSGPLNPEMRRAFAAAPRLHSRGRFA